MAKPLNWKKVTPDKIKGAKSVNIKMPYGYLFAVPGIVSRLYNGEQQFWINGRWVSV